MVGRQTFNLKMRVQFPLEVPKMLLSTNGRSLDFQSKNTGSIPVRSAKYPYRLTAGHVDFQSIDTSSNLVGDAK